MGETKYFNHSLIIYMATQFGLSLTCFEKKINIFSDFPPIFSPIFWPIFGQKMPKKNKIMCEN